MPTVCAWLSEAVIDSQKLSLVILFIFVRVILDGCLSIIPAGQDGSPPYPLLVFSPYLVAMQTLPGFSPSTQHMLDVDFSRPGHLTAHAGCYFPEKVSSCMHFKGRNNVILTNVFRYGASSSYYPIIQGHSKPYTDISSLWSTLTPSSPPGSRNPAYTGLRKISPITHTIETSRPKAESGASSHLISCGNHSSTVVRILTLSCSLSSHATLSCPKSTPTSTLLRRRRCESALIPQGVTIRFFGACA